MLSCSKGSQVGTSNVSKPVIMVHLSDGAGTFMCTMANLSGNFRVWPNNKGQVNCDSPWDNIFQGAVRTCAQRQRDLASSGITFAATARGFEDQREFCPREFNYVVLLRHPMERVLTWVRSAVQPQWGNTSIPSLIRAIKAGDNSTLFFADLLRRPLSSTNENMRENPDDARALRRVLLPRIHDLKLRTQYNPNTAGGDGMRMLLDNGMTRMLSLDSAILRAPMLSLNATALEKAKRTLEQFSFVITTGALNDDPGVASMAFQSSVLGFPAQSPTRPNHHAKHADTEAEREFFRTLNHLDIDLYRHAQELYNRRHRDVAASWLRKSDGLRAAGLCNDNEPCMGLSLKGNAKSSTTSTASFSLLTLASHSSGTSSNPYISPQAAAEYNSTAVHRGLVRRLHNYWKDILLDGVLIVGDSLARNMFSELCSDVLGLSMAARAQFEGNITAARRRPGVFVCPTTNGFQASYAKWLRPSQDSAQMIRHVKGARARYVYLSLPGIHFLWSPGLRELTSACGDYVDMGAVAREYHTTLGSLFEDAKSRNRTVVVGMGSAICATSIFHLGNETQFERHTEMRMAETYLQGDPIAPGDTKLRELANWQAAELLRSSSQKRTNSSSGRRPTREDIKQWNASLSHRVTALPHLYCDNGQYDSYTLSDPGIQRFNQFTRTTILAPFPDVVAVDMHTVVSESDGCSHTLDGKHFDSYVRQRQLSAIWSAFLIGAEGAAAWASCHVADSDVAGGVRAGG